MPSKQKPSSPPRRKAVDEKHAPHSPTGDAAAGKTGVATRPKARPEDMPGAAGLTSARADEDTYD